MDELEFALPKYRANRVNRRTAAFLIDSTVATLLASAVFVNFDIDGWASFAGFETNFGVLGAAGLLLLLRDVLPISSKKLFGLEVQTTTGEVPSFASRVLRNVPFMIPFMWIVEYFVAYFGGDSNMLRIGDGLAHTKVVDVNPKRFGKGSGLVLAILVLIGVSIVSQVVEKQLNWKQALGNPNSQNTAPPSD